MAKETPNGDVVAKASRQELATEAGQTISSKALAYFQWLTDSLHKMFNPNAQNAKKAEKAAKKKALAELKAYSETLIPQELHNGVCSCALFCVPHFVV
jgi:ElaB/YqjD/DUF883 family membrane-anchored ribosome-binding protein